VNEVQRYLVEEFVEDYHARTISRRELLRRAALIMGSVAAGTAAIREAERALAATPARVIRAGAYPGALSAPVAEERGERTLPPLEVTTAFVVLPDDPDIAVETVSFPGEAGAVVGYLARPAAAGLYPGVVVIHENRGLIEPNLDIARRFAKEGFVALAPDLLSRVGGTGQFADEPSRATGAIGQLGPDAPAADGNAAAAYLLTLPWVNGALGATGYCFGGGVVWRMGVRNPDLRAIVPYYGSNPPLDEVPNLRAAALGIYGEADTRITGAAADLAAKLEEVGATWEFWVAPGAPHAFMNNTSMSFRPDAAREAWRRTLAWFDRFLRLE
jgi:carboxymethylenebutenolidase